MLEATLAREDTELADTSPATVLDSWPDSPATNDRACGFCNNHGCPICHPLTGRSQEVYTGPNANSQASSDPSTPYTPPVPEDSAPVTPTGLLPLDLCSQITPAPSLHWDEASQVTDAPNDIAMADAEHVEYALRSQVDTLPWFRELRARRFRAGDLLDTLTVAVSYSP
eukprot:5542471-Heterocapsa_arctica.AAC.1